MYIWTGTSGASLYLPSTLSPLLTWIPGILAWKGIKVESYVDYKNINISFNYHMHIFMPMLSNIIAGFKQGFPRFLLVSKVQLLPFHLESDRTLLLWRDWVGSCGFCSFSTEMWWGPHWTTAPSCFCPRLGSHSGTEGLQWGFQDQNPTRAGSAPTCYGKQCHSRTSTEKFTEG